MQPFRLLPWLALGSLIAAVPACQHRQCVPEELAFAPLHDVCAEPYAHSPDDSAARLKEIATEFRRRAGSSHPPGTPPYQMLALSGGGFYGAFGIGVLAGWTESGTRPAFDVVTGISAGALMATFAFLGPEYDGVLRDEGVGIGLREILRRRSLFRIPFADAVFTSWPLRDKIERAITPEILAAVAREHLAGRRLYVGTTNLDTRRLVVWDMGAIAARGTPEAFHLYRQIILASSSIPGAFPPVRIPVEIDGVWYEELHVDGGASDQVMFRPFMVADLNRVRGRAGSSAPAGSTFYVVNNGKLYADPACVRPRIVPMANASLRSISYGKGRDELYRIYLNCLETGIEFRLTAIPQDFHATGSGGLQLARDEQQQLYEIGRRIGSTGPVGAAWRDLPPSVDPAERAVPRAGTRFISGP